MVKVSNVLFVIFLIGVTASKQLQGQAATLSLKSKQKIADLINEMIPKETREALQKEGLLEKNFTDKVYSTVIEEMTNEEMEIINTIADEIEKSTNEIENENQSDKLFHLTQLSLTGDEYKGYEIINDKNRYLVKKY